MNVLMRNTISRALSATPLIAAWLAATPFVAFSANADPGGGMAARMSLETSAEAGDPFAAFVAGRRHLIAAGNSGNAEDRRIGLGFIAQAADAGFAPAARFAGSLYLNGELVERDVNAAITWFTRAAKLGDTAAQHDLGDLYAEGDLVPQDLTLAALWYETALANPEADYTMNRLYEVAYELGALYADGLGIGADPVKARALWQEAADKAGYPPAIKALAKAYSDGIGGPVDRGKALDTYLDAATAFRAAGIHFRIGPDAARREVADILDRVRLLEAGSHLVKRIEKEMEEIAIP
ncbi:MAG: sel1 repeat family protein [Nitrospirae bacterium]|nr:sel1 repeat family protein [Nitrospirota bacterium]